MRGLQALPFVLVGAAALWPEWMRFRLETPSLTDDWFGVTYSKAAFHALTHGSYAASELDYAGRYRPTYTAVWDYAQWHLLGNPSMATAAGWAALRAILFLGAVWVLAGWLRERRPSAGSPVWLVPFAVALTPGFAVSLARYGPGDPLMIAGLVFGIGLMAHGTRALLAGSQQGRLRALCMVAFGYAFYLFGVYVKEASICLLAFVPFFLMWLGPSARARIPHGRKPRIVLAGLVALTLAPLIHLAASLLITFTAGDRPYPLEHTFQDKVLATVVSPLLGAPGLLKTWLWTLAVPVAVAVVIGAARRRDRDAWLLSGILVTGFLMSALSLVRGELAIWYFVPWGVAVAVVAFRGIQSSKLAQLAVGVLVVGVALTTTRHELSAWAALERSSTTAIEVTKGSVATGCPVYLSNFDIEQRVAIPLLFGFVQPARIGGCANGAAYAVDWGWRKRSLSRSLTAACATGWERVSVENRIRLFRCSSISNNDIPNQISASGAPRITAVRLDPRAHVPKPRYLFQPR